MCANFYAGRASSIHFNSTVPRARWETALLPLLVLTCRAATLTNTCAGNNFSGKCQKIPRNYCQYWCSTLVTCLPFSSALVGTFKAPIHSAEYPLACCRGEVDWPRRGQLLGQLFWLHGSAQSQLPSLSTNKQLEDGFRWRQINLRL